MERRALVGTGVVVLIAVVLLVIVAVSYDPGPRTSYDYTINDVYTVTYDNGNTEYRVDVDFYPSLDEGVTITATCNGISLGEYTTTRDGVSNLKLIVYPPSGMSVDTIRHNVELTFSA